MGAEVVPISLPASSEALGAYYVLASAEAASNLGRFDGVRFGFRSDEDSPGTGTAPKEVYAATRSETFGDEVKRRILLGAYALSAEAFDNYFLHAQKLRLLLRRQYDTLLRTPSALSLSTEPNTEGVDLLLTPTALTPPPQLSTVLSGGVRGAWEQDSLLVPASLAGLPALSVPVGGSGPGIGVQLVGQWGGEEGLLKVAEQIQGIE